MDYIVIKSPKSKGLAILLVFLLGPVGLFYASVRAGITMSLLPFVAGVAVVAFGLNGDAAIMIGALGFLVFFVAVYWIVCFVWAITAVQDYNKNLVVGAANYQGVNAVGSNPYFSLDGEQESPNQFRAWAKNVPYKSVNDFYKESRAQGVVLANSLRSSYLEEDSKVDFGLIALWVVCVLVLVSVLLMYSRDDQSFGFSNLLRFF